MTTHTRQLQKYTRSTNNNYTQDNLKLAQRKTSNNLKLAEITEHSATNHLTRSSQCTVMFRVLCHISHTHRWRFVHDWPTDRRHNTLSVVVSCRPVISVPSSCLPQCARSHWNQRYRSIIILIIIIFIHCNWVVTRWQWLFYMYTEHEIGYY